MESRSEPTLIAESLPKISSFEARRSTARQQPTYAFTFWRDSNVPERHRAKAADRDKATGPWAVAYQKLKTEMFSGSLIVLLGKRGTGKTQLAVDLVADMCELGGESKYLKVMDLFREIRSCYRPDGPDEVKTIAKLCQYRTLVIDEAHERSDSEWENRTLTNIIDRRYDAMRSTILVSNMTREAFAAAVGPSIVSRTHESGVVVVCDWPSFREAR